MHGRHLTIDDREVIAQMRAAGLSQAQVARRLRCRPSTVSRELRRNAEAGGDYRPSRAQARADRRRRHSKQSWKLEGSDPGACVRDRLRPGPSASAANIVG